MTWRLRTLGGDLTKPGIGVYQHLIWERDDLTGSKHQRYVGQSMNWAQRIANHRNQLNWIKHPSLHYSFVSRDNMMDEFVILTEIFASKTEMKNLSLLLNLLEIWCAVRFQTLQKHDLETYLPPISSPTRIGLNLTLPLWQSTGNAPELFKTWLLSSDAEAQSFAEQARQNAL